MNLTAITVTLAKAKGVLDGVFAVSSLIVVPALLTVPIVWILERPYQLRFKPAQPQTISASSYQGLGSSMPPTVVFPGLELTQKPLRTVYHMELVGDNGESVYSYPTIETRQSPKFDNVLLPIPHSVKSGNYKLVAHVSYTMNPITSVDATVIVASLNVD